MNGRAMTFTVTRAVRSAESPTTEPADRLQPTIRITPDLSAKMDLPYAEEVLHLDLNDFAETVPGDSTE